MEVDVDLIEKVGRRYEEMREAAQRYEDAVFEAHRAGVPNTRLARRIGMTETAVRLYIKRRSGRK